MRGQRAFAIALPLARDNPPVTNRARRSSGASMVPSSNAPASMSSSSSRGAARHS